MRILISSSSRTIVALALGLAAVVFLPAPRAQSVSGTVAATVAVAAAPPSTPQESTPRSPQPTPQSPQQSTPRSPQQSTQQPPPSSGRQSGAGRQTGAGARTAAGATAAPGQTRGGTNFDQQVQQQAQVDAVWKAASEGVMKMTKTSYKSRVDGMDIPVFVFQPLTIRGPKQHAALVWVHPDIRGRLYAYYFPYVRDAVSRGYTVIAPEYRGSVGYGQAHYDAIDYGGAEVDDVVTAVSYLKTNCPEVDPARIGIIGWSHGGMITLLSITREATMFKAAAALVPVTNLFQRLAWAGVDRQHQAIDPANRYGGLPGDARANQVYKDRSPIYQIDKLQIPLLVHITKNDQDVHIEEDMQLVDALRARKSNLAETKIYDNPQGGHLFDRQCPWTESRTAVDSQKLESYTPTMTREQRDSWARVWAFLDFNLDPYHGPDGK